MPLSTRLYRVGEHADLMRKLLLSLGLVLVSSSSASACKGDDPSAASAQVAKAGGDTSTATAPRSAAEVCKKLESAGVAAGCKSEKPGGIGAAASEKQGFTFPGKEVGGQVLSFEKLGFYDSTVKTFEGMASLAGRHQYGNAKALIFVQLNADAPEDLAKKTKAIVEGL